MYEAAAQAVYNDVLDTYAKIQRDIGDGTGVMINDLYRNKRYQDLLEHINGELEKLGGKEVKITEKHLLDLYAASLKAIDDGVPKSAIRTAFLYPTAMNADQVVHQHWVLDGVEFSDRIWTNKQKLLTNLNKSLTDFAVRGKPGYQVATELMDVMHTAEYNATRIVRTETAHLQNYVQTQRFMEMGFTKGRWLGQDCCDHCKEYDNKVYTLKELQSAIPAHPNCRCTYTLELD